MGKLDDWSKKREYERMANSSELQVRRINSRLLIKDSEHTKPLGPIIDYAQEPILPLADACAPLVDIVAEILTYVSVALEHTPDKPADDLTREESASIHLYTMEWAITRDSLYSKLNRTLKAADREDLRPWFKYLKLFLTALAKVPCIPPQTVWRGVRKNISDEFPKGAQVTWWAFASTTASLTVLESDLYLGTVGERTLFPIEVLNGRSVRAHSHFDTEEEILLLPGTLMEVQSQFNPAPGLHIIHLKQMIPEELLLEPPFEGACLYPKIESSRRWFTKKSFLIPMSILAIVCILGAVLGSVLGSKHSAKTSGPVVNWNGSDSAMACDFTGNELSFVRSPSKHCERDCTQTPGCTHYTWKWNGGTCWMKKGNVTKNDAVPTNNPNMICGVINGDHQEATNSTVLWNGNNWAMSCDFYGNDLSDTAISSERCGGQCAQTPGCTHFTWSPSSDGTCWMKKGNVSKSDAFSTNDPTMICGVINGDHQEVTNSTVVWNGNNWAMSCDFYRNDLSNTPSSSELCEEKCAQTPGCTHFTWSQWNDGTCWMKKGHVSKSDAFSTNDPTMICGVITSM